MNGSVNFFAGYVSGVLCSDGKIVWNEKYGNYAISLETMTKELADLFLNNLTRVIEKRPRVGKHKRIVGGSIVHMNTVTVYGKKIIENFMNRWGLRCGKRDWVVPRLCWNDKEFRRGFLRGFFDGSGSVSSVIRSSGGKRIKERALRIYSINRKGLSVLKELLLTESIKSILYASGDCYVIKIGGKTRMRLFKETVGFGLTHKKQRLEEALLPLTLSGNEVVV